VLKNDVLKQADFVDMPDPFAIHSPFVHPTHQQQSATHGMVEQPALPHTLLYAPFLKCHLTTGIFIHFTIEEGRQHVGLD